VFIDAMAQGAANGSLPELYQNYFWSRRPPKTAKFHPRSTLTLPTSSSMDSIFFIQCSRWAIRSVRVRSWSVCSESWVSTWLSSPAAVPRRPLCRRCPKSWPAMLLAPESGEHPDDDVERPRAAVDRHDIGALPQPQRRKQTRNAEHVVEMAVRQQEPIEPSEASAAPE
jgi:hypothetical protein